MLSFLVMQMPFI